MYVIGIYADVNRTDAEMKWCSASMAGAAAHACCTYTRAWVPSACATVGQAAASLRATCAEGARTHAQCPQIYARVRNTSAPGSGTAAKTCGTCAQMPFADLRCKNAGRHFERAQGSSENISSPRPHCAPAVMNSMCGQHRVNPRRSKVRPAQPTRRGQSEPEVLGTGRKNDPTQKAKWQLESSSKQVYAV